MTRWILSACLVAMLGTFKGSVSEELGFRHVALAEAERQTSTGGIRGAWNVQAETTHPTHRISSGDVLHAPSASAVSGAAQPNVHRSGRPFLHTLVASFPRFWNAARTQTHSASTESDVVRSVPPRTSADILAVLPPTWEDIRPTASGSSLTPPATTPDSETARASLGAKAPSVAMLPRAEKTGKGHSTSLPARDYTQTPTRRTSGVEGADDLLDHPLFRSYYDTALKYYQGRARSTVRVAAVRYSALEDRMAPLFESAEVPAWLLGVAVVEAGLNPAAVAPSGHAGLWQLSGDTARRLGLSVGRGRDERLDAVASTRAALKHLSELHARYGEWPLALAAYNLGSGRVDKALARRPGACLCQLVDRGLLPSMALQNVARYFAAATQILERIDPETGRTVALSDAP